jgi:(p)ppGpp synthase/HD superfamily hydrolase
MITSIFGEVVASQVMDLTRIKEDGRKISSAEMVELLFKQKKYDLLFIKQFDRLHNIQTISAKSPEKIKKTVRETLQTFLILAAYLGIPKIEQELSELCIRAKLGDQDLLSAKQKFSFENSPNFLSLTFENEIDRIYNPKLPVP